RGAADPAQVAELRRLRARLDPFQPSASIEAKLKAIFALSREAPAPLRATRPQASAPAQAVPDPQAVPRPALGRTGDRGPSSSDSRQNGRPRAVEMTRRGKRGKLQKPRRVSNAYLRD